MPKRSKRSLAASRGWETRRRNAERARRSAAAVKRWQTRREHQKQLAKAIRAEKRRAAKERKESFRPLGPPPEEREELAAPDYEDEPEEYDAGEMRMPEPWDYADFGGDDWIVEDPVIGTGRSKK